MIVFQNWTNTAKQSVEARLEEILQKPKCLYKKRGQFSLISEIVSSSRNLLREFEFFISDLVLSRIFLSRILDFVSDQKFESKFLENEKMSVKSKKTDHFFKNNISTRVFEGFF